MPRSCYEVASTDEHGPVATLAKRWHDVRFVLRTRKTLRTPNPAYTDCPETTIYTARFPARMLEGISSLRRTCWRESNS